MDGDDTWLRASARYRVTGVCNSSITPAIGRITPTMSLGKCARCAISQAGAVCVSSVRAGSQARHEHSPAAGALHLFPSIHHHNKSPKYFTIVALLTDPRRRGHRTRNCPNQQARSGREEMRHRPQTALVHPSLRVEPARGHLPFSTLAPAADRESAWTTTPYSIRASRLISLPTAIARTLRIRATIH